MVSLTQINNMPWLVQGPTLTSQHCRNIRFTETPA